MGNNIRYSSFGAHAILIAWESIVSKKILDDILSFKNKIAEFKEGKYTDLVIGYNSLTILYNTKVVDFDREVKSLKEIYKVNIQNNKITNYLLEIPVCYHPEFGIDINDISEKLQKTNNDVIELHTHKIYTVFFIGFLPGFMYLGGLNNELFFDRKPNPRLKVPKGSVAIGGQQTGVYPMESAGGWNIIGRTPISFFDIDKTNPCFVKAGDQIKFKAVSKAAFYEIASKLKQKTYHITKTVLHG